MSIGDSMSPEAAAYLRAASRIPAVVEGYNLTTVNGSKHEVVMPLETFVRIGEAFNAPSSPTPEFEEAAHVRPWPVIKPQDEHVAIHFQRSSDEQPEAAEAFDRVQEELEGAQDLEFQSYAVYTHGAVKMALAAYQELGHTVLSRKRVTTEPAVEKFVAGEDQLHRINQLSLKVFGASADEVPLLIPARDSSVTIPLGSLEVLVEQAARGGLNTGWYPENMDKVKGTDEEGETGTEDECDVAVSRETFAPLRLDQVAMLCAHGYPICALCDHVPASWKMVN